MSQEQEQEEVQVYLQQHAIGALFEEMMAGLLAETPEEPITFLIRHLKEEKDRRSPLETIVRGGETHNYATLCLEGKQPKKSKSDLTVSSMSKILGKSRPLSQSLELSSWSKRTCSEITGSGCLLQKCPQGDMAASSENAATEEFTKAQGGQTVPFPDGSSAALEISVNHGSRGTATTKIYWQKEEGDPLSEEMLSPPVPRRGLPRMREDLDDCWRGDKWQSQVQQKAQHARHLAALLCQELADGEGAICPHKEDTGEVEEEPMLVDDWDELWCESLLIPTASLDAAHTMVRLGLCTHCHRRRNRTECMGKTSQSVRISLTDRMTYAIAANKGLKKSAPEPPALPPSQPELKGEGLAWLGRATATPACKDLTWVTGAPAKPVVSQPSRSSTKDPLPHVPKVKRKSGSTETHVFHPPSAPG